MRFVVVTGMSGSGKRTAMKMLEDIGFYCVDNLPIPLIDRFVELLAAPGSEITKVALGLDVRADQNFSEAEQILDRMRSEGYQFELGKGAVLRDGSDVTVIAVGINVPMALKAAEKLAAAGKEVLMEDAALSLKETLAKLIDQINARNT